MPAYRWENSSVDTAYTYNSWAHMKDRCLNPDAHNFDFYGGRGIEVCERWRDDYDAFYEDMGSRPVGMTIERIDNNGNYEPGNCCWAPMSAQVRNRRNAHMVTHRGVTKSIIEWAETLGVSWGAVKQYVRRGTVERNIDRLISRMEF